MKKPTMEEVEKANPDFFDPEYLELYLDATYRISLDKDRNYYVPIVDHKYGKPIYEIKRNLELKFIGHDV